MSSPSVPGRKKIYLLLAALLCAAPFLCGAYYLQNLAREIDTLPLDSYTGLRWAPDMKELAFLHRPLQQTPAPETEIWKVNSTASAFRPVGNLPANYEWTLTSVHSDDWMFLEGKNQAGDSKMVLSDGDGRVKNLEIKEPWTRIPSQGNGLFFESVETEMPFDQFVEVEDAPELEPSNDQGEDVLEPEVQNPDSFDGPGTGDSVASPPTRHGLKVARYNDKSGELDIQFTIPYSKPSERPVIQLARLSPDQRFLAIIVQFGEAGTPGLWIFDSEKKSLLWSRLRVTKLAFGLDWSSDSVQVAVSDSKGVSILEDALGVESSRFEVAAHESLLPMWGAGQQLYLVNSRLVYQMQIEQRQAVPLFDSDSHSLGVTDMVLDPVGSRVAYSASPKGYHELVVADLKNGQAMARAIYPGSIKQKSQGSLWYQLGNAIRHSWLNFAE